MRLLSVTYSLMRCVDFTVSSVLDRDEIDVGTFSARGLASGQGWCDSLRHSPVLKDKDSRVELSPLTSCVTMVLYIFKLL